jgi:hypothetical protein
VGSAEVLVVGDAVAVDRAVPVGAAAAAAVGVGVAVAVGVGVAVWVGGGVGVAVAVLAGGEVGVGVELPGAEGGSETVGVPVGVELPVAGADGDPLAATGGAAGTGTSASPPATVCELSVETGMAHVGSPAGAPPPGR